jgi:chitinase
LQIASYGRQFKMTDPSCVGKHCTFIGPEGVGTLGRCTNESAYISNAEIKEIIARNPSAKVVDTGGNSKLLTYDGNWFSFMDDKDKIARTNLWKSMSFGGVIEWAIDLNTFEFDNNSNGPNGPGGFLPRLESAKRNERRYDCRKGNCFRHVHPGW